MRITAALVSLLVLAGVAHAAADRNADLRRLSTRLETALADRDLDSETANRIRVHLEEALEAVNAQQTYDRRCMELATRVYSGVYQKSSAVDMALTLCKTVEDSDVLQLAFDVYSGPYQGTNALAMAAKIASRSDLRGKAPLLRFAMDAYEGTYQKTNALLMSVDLVAGLPANALGCVETVYAANTQFQPTGRLKIATDKCR